jgi:hypothetical protein
MIIKSDNYNIRIYKRARRDPQIALSDYNEMLNDVYAIDISKKDIPSNLKIEVPIMGSTNGNVRFDGGVFVINLKNNIIIEFDNKNESLMFFKAFLKMKTGEVTSLENE